jgi:hypothetical protein
MKFKAKLIEVCAGHKGTCPRAVLEFEDIEQLREFSVYLYENVSIEVPIEDTEHSE